MQAAGRNTDLRTHAEFAAIGELGRGIVHHDRRIDRVKKFLRCRRVLGDDRIRVMGTVGVDVIDRALLKEVVDNPLEVTAE